VAIGFLFVGLGLPLVRHQVKPNRWYGFRLSKTRRDPDLWFLVNEYAGRLLVRLGVVLVLAAAGGVLVPGVTLDAYVASCAAVIYVGLLLGNLRITRYMRSLVPH
jgi:hypothetical protein